MRSYETDIPDYPLQPGATPEYVPPHLRGKVWDFREEPGGNISFAHPDAAPGLGPSDSRVSIGRDVYDKTFSKAHRYGGFSGAMRGQYAPLNRVPRSPGESLNDMIAGKLRGLYDWGTSTQGKSIGTAGLLSSLAGGIGGYMLGASNGEPSIKKSLILALLAGAAGAGTMALSQRNHNKREAWLSKKASSMDVASGIISLLESDRRMSGQDRAKVLQAIVDLRSHEREELYRLLRASAGAGVGALAMRFLGAKGLLPMAAGAILGGLIGGRRPGPKYNAQGQLSY